MTWKPSCILAFCLLSGYGSAQEMAQISGKTQISTAKNGCSKSIFVESPVADTYVASAEDTVSFGYESTLKVKGLPERKAMSAMISYEVHHLDPNYLQKALLKVYTASKDRGDYLQLYSAGEQVDEFHTNWENKPVSQEFLDRKPVTDAPFIIFEITEFARGHLKDGFLNFQLISDGKKTIDIASRESGLSAELIIDMCTSQDASFDLLKDQESSLKVLPCTLNGKMTIQLWKVPAGGFGDLMIMTDQGDILYQIPISIQDAEVSYHTIDFHNLLPGVYWAVLRKGRVMVKDRFRLKPESGTTFLKVDDTFVAENEP